MEYYRMTLYTEDQQAHTFAVTPAAFRSVRRALADIRGSQDKRRLQVETKKGVVFDQPLGRLLPLIEWEKHSK